MSDSAPNIGISSHHLTGLSLAESASVAPKHAAWLLVETVSLTIAAVLTIRLLADTSLHESLWFLSPAVLVAAALIPPIARKDRFPEIGLCKKKAKEVFLVLACTCVVVFGAAFFGLWLLTRCGFEPSLRVVPQGNRQILSWLLYQFLYVALAEEVFFRGYLQSNILRLTATIRQEADRASLRNWISIILSAVCFAAAHVIVQGQAISVLTFLPGIVLGWLFIRTKSLLAPIIFHGLANIFYCICTSLLA
jgi:membrane protease YdiL (CAAX protease family)